jgi:hypothetical protein
MAIIAQTLHPPKMRIFLSLLASTLTFAAAHAEVVVYKGAGTCLQPNDINQFGKTPHFYYIVDLKTHESFPIFYFTLAGKKQSQGSFPLESTHYDTAPGANGKTIGVFNFVFDNGSVANFSTLSFYFRGKAVTVPTSSSSTGLFPKTMSGTFRGLSHNNGNPISDEINFVLNFDAFQTQAANNALKDGATAYSDILAELSAKGYN